MIYKGDSYWPQQFQANWKQGYVFENTSKEYKVEKVDSYAKVWRFARRRFKENNESGKDMVEANLKTGKLSNCVLLQGMNWYNGTVWFN